MRLRRSEFTRCTDLTSGERLGLSNACQLLFPFLAPPDSIDPSLTGFLDLLGRMGLADVSAATGEARAPRRPAPHPSATLLLLLPMGPFPSAAERKTPPRPFRRVCHVRPVRPQPVFLDPPRLRSAEPPPNEPQPGPSGGGGWDPASSLRCHHGFAAKTPLALFGNCLGERFGRWAREDLALPFSVVYRIDQLATSGALCPSLRGCVWYGRAWARLPCRAEGVVLGVTERGLERSLRGFQACPRVRAQALRESGRGPLQRP